MAFLEDVLSSMSTEGVDLLVIGLLMLCAMVFGLMWQRLAAWWDRKHSVQDEDETAEQEDGLANPVANMHRISVMEKQFIEHKRVNHQEHTEMMTALTAMKVDVATIGSDVGWIRQHMQNGKPPPENKDT